MLSEVAKDLDGIYYYRGREIESESNSSALKQQVYVEGDMTGTGNNCVEVNGHQVGSIKEYLCRKINGVKYYLDDNNKVFCIINDKKYEQNINPDIIRNNDNAVKYYEDAYNFKRKFESGGILESIRHLKVSDAVDSNGKKYIEYGENNPYFNYGEVFSELFASSNKISIEDSNSNFNAHKMQVIKNSIESNLMVAIENYNKVSSSQVNFQMPKLQDSEWEQIGNNISMITFLQGLNIGGKIYNGYSIVSNNNNEDYVSENSIYIVDDHKREYYRVTDPLLFSIDTGMAYGILNTDFQRRMGTVSYGSNDENKMSKTIYYYPRQDIGSYSSIIDPNGVDNNNNINKFLEYRGEDNDSEFARKTIAKKYYTALGRERYGMYRVTNKLEEIQEILK